MTRRHIFFACLLLAACGRPSPVPPETLLPPALASWNREELSAVPPSAAPAEVRALGLERAYRASYRGAGAVQVTFYSMSSQTAAFELAQKWPPAPDSVVFHQDSHFVALHWRDSPRAGLQAFVTALRNHLRSLSR